jgi:hypothetical protein
MTLCLLIDLSEAISEESRIKGDLARIVLFALSHVEEGEVDIQQTRKAGMDQTNHQLIHVGSEARTKLKEWAEAEGMSINVIVVSVLDELFKRLKKSKALREELRLEICAHRGIYTELNSRMANTQPYESRWNAETTEVVHIPKCSITSGLAVLSLSKARSISVRHPFLPPFER